MRHLILLHSCMYVCHVLIIIVAWAMYVLEGHHAISISHCACLQSYPMSFFCGAWSPFYWSADFALSSPQISTLIVEAVPLHAFSHPGVCAIPVAIMAKTLLSGCMNILLYISCYLALAFFHHHHCQWQLTIGPVTTLFTHPSICCQHYLTSFFILVMFKFYQN